MMKLNGKSIYFSKSAGAPSGCTEIDDQEEEVEEEVAEEEFYKSLKSMKVIRGAYKVNMFDFLI